jgi:hypothetical protein
MEKLEAKLQLSMGQIGGININIHIISYPLVSKY